MAEGRPYNPVWIAPRSGQDWRDEAILRAIDWLVSLVPRSEWETRQDTVEANYLKARVLWAEGDRVPLFSPDDTVSWYIHQARRYADPKLRTQFFYPEGYRIAPIFKRIGDLLPFLRAIEGAEARAARLMTQNISQPDDGLFELLVAGAYAVRGWDRVSFVPESKGLEKTPDLLVDRPNSSWAIECKRAGRHGYAREEREAGERLASHAHVLSKAAARPIIVLVSYNAELHLLYEKYLGERVQRFLDTDTPIEWEDEGGQGAVMDVAWEKLHAVMRHDDIYFGSSRMVELLLGKYHPIMDFTVAGDWTPAKGRPFHATWVDHASLVVWRSLSDEAARRKSMHFRSLVARAAQQLPGDRPGAIHVGYEAVGGNSEDARRHRLNQREMHDFDPESSDLRVVYGNYFMSEMVTARNESAAVNETTAWYPIGKKQFVQPLPGHLLFGNDKGTDGSHL